MKDLSMARSVLPTIREVAQKAGVGTTTVSRVINGGDRVRPETLKHVQEVIDVLGYIPNQAARTLKGNHTKTIGLIIPSIADPFFSSCAGAIEKVVQVNDSLLLVTTTNDNSKVVIEKINFMVRHQTDGIIITPVGPESDALKKLLPKLPMPLITIDRPIIGLNTLSVMSSNFEGACLATKHLIKHGYTRIFCLTGESTLYTINERIRGYQKTVKAAGLPCIIDTSVKDYKSVELIIEQMLTRDKFPDAIFTLKNSMTAYAFRALQKFHISIPGSVALLGYDDFDLASTLRPSISVIQQPIEKIGQIAAETLFKKIFSMQKSNKPFFSKPENIQLDTQLILRESCGCL